MREENKNCIYAKTCNHTYCDSFCEKKYRSEYYLSYSLLSSREQQKLDILIDSDECDKEAFNQLFDIEENIYDFVQQGKNLYIYSSGVGNGKTTEALRILLSYVEEISKPERKKKLEPKVLFISVPKYLREIKEFDHKSEYIQSIEEVLPTAELVVWDDIGHKDGTEFEVSNLLSIIDQRLHNYKTNIYTSNLNENELHECLGDRLYSRIWQYSTCVQLVGKDKRRVDYERGE